MTDRSVRVRFMVCNKYNHIKTHGEQQTFCRYISITKRNWFSCTFDSEFQPLVAIIACDVQGDWPTFQKASWVGLLFCIPLRKLPTVSMRHPHLNLIIIVASLVGLPCFRCYGALVELFRLPNRKVFLFPQTALPCTVFLEEQPGRGAGSVGSAASKDSDSRTP